MNLKDSKRVIIKIGSALVADSEKASLNKAWLKSLCEDVAKLQKNGTEVILVSSGAVALGKKYIPGKHLKLEDKQAAAACGQIDLIEYYQQMLKPHKLRAAQILLTMQDSEDRRRYLNARNTIENLLKSGIIPIINENDTVATNELRFGDNDRLASRVAQMLGADTLILLSDVDGLYDKDPRLSINARHIAEVTEITDTIEKSAGESVSDVGSGGMKTKIIAAKIALQNGCHTIIADGTNKNPIKSILNGAKCTWFISSETPLNARKSWIASSLNMQGSIIIDKGALNALKDGKSLLPAGVIDVEGTFERGDTVIIKDHQLNEIGFGLIAYSSTDTLHIKGHRSTDIKHIVGFTGRDELIHRGDLVLRVK